MDMKGFPNDLLDTDSLTKEDIIAIFERAEFFEKNKSAICDVLKDKTVVLAFFENSTRTRASFELAAKRLGATTLNFSSNGSSISKGESLADTIRTIDAMGVDCFVVRNSSNGTPTFIKSVTPTPLINAGDGKHQHPTQALLDGYTILKHFNFANEPIKNAIKCFENLKVSIVGDIINSRVARSNAAMLHTLGSKVALCGPQTLLPAPHTMLPNISAVFDNIDDALKWSDVVILLRIQNERMQQGLIPSITAYKRDFQINLKRWNANPHCILLHPGPVNYGVEVSRDVTSNERVYIDRQVANGVLIRESVLSLAVKGNKVQPYTQQAI